MKVGDIVEAAIWITGGEPPDIHQRFKVDVCQAIDEMCDHYGLLHGPVTFVEKCPGDERVPPVPDHISGQRVRLLVAEAEVVARRPEETPASFVAKLDPKDLKRLRDIIHRAHKRQFPSHNRLTNEQADEIIEEVGPEAAIDTLRRSTG